MYKTTRKEYLQFSVTYHDLKWFGLRQKISAQNPKKQIANHYKVKVVVVISFWRDRIVFGHWSDFDVDELSQKFKSFFSTSVIDFNLKKRKSTAIISLA